MPALKLCIRRMPLLEPAALLAGGIAFAWRRAAAELGKRWNAFSAVLPMPPSVSTICAGCWRAWVSRSAYGAAITCSGRAALRGSICSERARTRSRTR